MIGNRVTEKDVRDWLDKRGFSGNSVHFKELELHAIRRPGWLQIYRFSIIARLQSGDKTTFFGAVRDDETCPQTNNRTKIMLFENAQECDNQLATWSEGLIQRRSGSTSSGSWIWPVLLVVMIAALWAISKLS